MLLAFFQRYESKPAHGANTDKNYKGEHTDRPFEYGSCLHSLPQMNTDRTQITSLAVAASIWEARLKISLIHPQRRPQANATVILASEVSAFSHELLDLAYDTIQFIDEIRMIPVLTKCGHERSVIPNRPVLFSAEPLEHFETMSSKLSQNCTRVMQLVRR